MIPTYNNMINLLPNEEIHYISDCDIFFDENPDLLPHTEDYNLIIFEYTMGDRQNIIKTLELHNIKYEIHSDEFDLDIIIF
tara:strand:- start:284 stop:526 length:243 start_codon:yes stop_codon:yes gene_type:complete